MLSEPCPRCGKNANVIGGISSSETFPHFQPYGIRWLEHFRKRFFQTTCARLKDPARACLDCGLVWTTAFSLGELRRIVEREEITIGLKKEELEL